MATPMPWGLVSHSGGLWPPAPDASDLFDHNPHYISAMGAQANGISSFWIAFAFGLLSGWFAYSVVHIITYLSLLKKNI
jgi:hypothetical protein